MSAIAPAVAALRPNTLVAAPDRNNGLGYVPDKSPPAGPDGTPPPPPAAIAAVTNAVVANWVVFVPGVAVGPAGVPVNVGDANGARAAKSVTKLVTCAWVSVIASEPPAACVVACAVGVRALVNRVSFPAAACCAPVPNVRNDPVDGAASTAIASIPPGWCVAACAVGGRLFVSRASFPATACVAPVPNVRNDPVPADASTAIGSAPPGSWVV